MILLNGKRVKFGNFPNGECYLENFEVRYDNKIAWQYEDDSEFFKLALIKHALDSYNKDLEILLSIAYMPHSRMDRRNTEYVMSLKVAARMINSLGFETILIREPHSDVTCALVENSQGVEFCQGRITTATYLLGGASIFFPDAGAAKRYSTALPYAVGFKRREFSSGRIVSFDLLGRVYPKVLIVDDLCSKGGTFIHSAKLLKKNGAESVNLMVANCEKTVLTGDLFEHIDILFVPKDHTFLKDHPQVKFI